jgi:FAD/FMN-containing dehydrogenase
MEDWGGVISFTPGQILRPGSLDELSSMLERIHRGELGNGGGVRVPGSLHSCSEIVVSDLLLDTSGMPRAIEFDVGDEAVEASANMSLHESLATLGARGNPRHRLQGAGQARQSGRAPRPSVRRSR